MLILSAMEFCKAFNAQTQGVEPGLPLPVVITAFADKSFTFVIKTPPAGVLIKKAIKLDKGSSTPHTVKVGKISRAQLEEIAKTKMKDMIGPALGGFMLNYDFTHPAHPYGITPFWFAGLLMVFGIVAAYRLMPVDHAVHLREA